MYDRALIILSLHIPLLKSIVSKIGEDLTHRTTENMIVIGKEMDFFMVVSLDFICSVVGIVN